MLDQEDTANRFFLVSGALAGTALLSGLIAWWVYPDDETGVSWGVSPTA